MRQLITIALVALLVAQASAAVNCSALMAPAANDDLYMPPSVCTSDPSIGACVSSFSICATAATTCNGLINICGAARQACVAQAEPIAASACAESQWYKNLMNTKLYLIAGGLYNGSALEKACSWNFCDLQTRYPTAAASGTCPTHEAICGTEPALSTTPDATLATYALSFQGDFTAILNNATAKALLVVALKTSIARILGTQPGFIRILSLVAGSLKCEFQYTGGGNLNEQAITQALTSTVGQSGQWDEITAVTGFEVTTASVVVTVPTPMPTPAPPGSGASLVSAAAAVVAVLAAALF
jgi:hypothetical protein